MNYHTHKIWDAKPHQRWSSKRHVEWNLGIKPAPATKVLLVEMETSHTGYCNIEKICHFQLGESWFPIWTIFIADQLEYVCLPRMQTSQADNLKFICQTLDHAQLHFGLDNTCGNYMQTFEAMA